MGQHKQSLHNLILYPEYDSLLDAVAPHKPGAAQLGNIFKTPYCAYSSATSISNFSGVGEVFVNNTCLISGSSAVEGLVAVPYQYDCFLQPAAAADKVIPLTAQNRFYAPAGATFGFACHNGSETLLLTLAQWQAMGHDANTEVVLQLPSLDELAAMVQAWLGFEGV